MAGCGRSPPGRVFALKGVERGSALVGLPTAVDVSRGGKRLRRGAKVRTVATGPGQARAVQPPAPAGAARRRAVPAGLRPPAQGRRRVPQAAVRRAAGHPPRPTRLRPARVAEDPRAQRGARLLRLRPRRGRHPRPRPHGRPALAAARGRAGRRRPGAGRGTAHGRRLRSRPRRRRRSRPASRPAAPRAGPTRSEAGSGGGKPAAGSGPEQAADEDASGHPAARRRRLRGGRHTLDDGPTQIRRPGLGALGAIGVTAPGPFPAVYRRGGPSPPVAGNARLTGRGRATRNEGRRGGSSFTRLAGRTTVPIFALVPPVTLKKRLDVEGAARRWIGRLSADLASPG